MHNHFHAPAARHQGALGFFYACVYNPHLVTTQYLSKSFEIYTQSGTIKRRLRSVSNFFHSEVMFAENMHVIDIGGITFFHLFKIGLNASFQEFMHV